jgi:glutaredoxin
MNKVRVLRLSGCSLCEALISKLEALRISYESIDADENDAIASQAELLLNTTAYPIIILDQSPITTYFFRANDQADLGIRTHNQQTIKAGCASVDGMVHLLTSILKT